LTVVSKNVIAVGQKLQASDIGFALERQPPAEDAWTYPHEATGTCARVRIEAYQQIPRSALRHPSAKDGSCATTSPIIELIQQTIAATGSIKSGEPSTAPEARTRSPVVASEVALAALRELAQSDIGRGVPFSELAEFREEFVRELAKNLASQTSARMNVRDSPPKSPSWLCQHIWFLCGD